MRDKFIYEYAILRLVPRVEREEFFNIGVIVYSRQQQFLGIKFNIDVAKFAAFGCDLELESIQNYLKSWEQICKGGTGAGTIGAMDMASRFRWLVSTRSTIIQSSKTHSGLCTKGENILEQLFLENVS